MIKKLDFCLYGEGGARFYALAMCEGEWLVNSEPAIIVAYTTTNKEFAPFVFEIYEQNGKKICYHSGPDEVSSVEGMMVEALYHYNIEPHLWKRFLEEWIDWALISDTDINYFSNMRKNLVNAIFRTRTNNLFVRQNRSAQLFVYKNVNMLDKLGFTDEQEDIEMSKVICNDST
jgi:hypothetical protein